MVTSPFVLSFTCCANLCASTARKSPSPSLAPGHWWDRRSVTAPAPPPLSASPQALSKPTNKTAPIARKKRRLSVVIFPFPRSLAAVIEIPSATRPPTLLRQTRQGISSLAASLTQYLPLLLFCSFPRRTTQVPGVGLVVAGDEGDGRANASIGDSDGTGLGKGDSRQIGEHVAGRELDEQSDAELEEQGSSVVPADRPFDAPGQVVTDLLRVAQRAATDIAQVRDDGRVHVNGGE